MIRGLQDRQRRSEWREGVYVRAYGHLTTVGRERSMVAFNLRTITDFNEVRPGWEGCSWLQFCCLQRMYLSVGSQLLLKGCSQD